jgi:hypothetical protein
LVLKIKVMETFLKKHLNEGCKVVFTNETTAKEDLYRVELSVINFEYTLTFGRVIYKSYYFSEFYKKFEEYKEKYSLQLKSW